MQCYRVLSSSHWLEYFHYKGELRGATMRGATNLCCQLLGTDFKAVPHTLGTAFPILLSIFILTLILLYFFPLGPSFKLLHRVTWAVCPYHKHNLTSVHICNSVKHDHIQTTSQKNLFVHSEVPMDPACLFLGPFPIPNKRLWIGKKLGHVN